MRPFKKNTIIAIMHIAQADTVTLTAWSGIMISKTRCLILRKSIGVATRFMIEPMTTIMFVICRIFFLLSHSFWIRTTLPPPPRDDGCDAAMPRRCARPYLRAAPPSRPQRSPPLPAPNLHPSRPPPARVQHPMHQDDAGHLHDQSRRQKSHTRHALEERREETGTHKREQGDKHERHRRDDAR